MQNYRSSRLAKALISFCVLGSSLARAQEEDDLNLGDLFEMKATTATKTEKSVAETPAIIRIITRQEIETWGISSVAEALVRTAGIYGVSDGTGLNFGIRGINGGLRASSRILKVMIDGQAVSFRSDSTVYLGKELIPIQAVERIEFVLGPASALYGANAFLGVVNVITRRPEAVGAQLAVRIEGRPSKGDKGVDGGLYASYRAEAHSGVLAFSGSRSDRSGRELPSDSPFAANFTDKTTANDIDQPSSAYARYGWKHKEWDYELSVNANRKDSYGEFLDFGTLSHKNHIAEDNQYVRNRLHWQLSELWGVNLQHSFATGEPSSQEKLSVGANESYPKRKQSYKSHDIQAELHYQWGNKYDVIAGLDFTQDDQTLMTVYNVNETTGSSSASYGEQGTLAFINRGAYLQYSGYPLEFAQDLGVTVNARTDRHSIYGNSNNYRLGLVQKLGVNTYGKLLYGTSFKVPSPGQLFAQPLYVGDVVGNDELKPESANTLEAQISSVLAKKFVNTLSLFYTKVKNRIELVPYGENQRPENAGLESSLGFELAVKTVWSGQHFNLDVGYQRSKEAIEEPLLDTIELPTTLYPALMTHLSWMSDSWSWAKLAAHATHVTERRASKGNISANRFKAYALEPYSLLHLSARKEFSLASHTSDLTLRIDNVLDRVYAEPGFGGVDIPGQRRTVRLILSSQL